MPKKHKKYISPLTLKKLFLSLHIKCIRSPFFNLFWFCSPVKTRPPHHQPVEQNELTWLRKRFLVSLFTSHNSTLFYHLEFHSKKQAIKNLYRAFGLVLVLEAVQLCFCTNLCHHQKYHLVVHPFIYLYLTWLD